MKVIKKEDIEKYLDTDYCLVELKTWNELQESMKALIDKNKNSDSIISSIRVYCEKEVNYCKIYNLGNKHCNHILSLLPKESETNDNR